MEFVENKNEEGNNNFWKILLGIVLGIIIVLLGIVVGNLLNKDNYYLFENGEMTEYGTTDFVNSKVLVELESLLSRWVNLKSNSNLCSSEFIDDIAKLGNDFIDLSEVEIIKSLNGDKSFEEREKSIISYYVIFGEMLVHLADLIEDNLIEEAELYLERIVEYENSGKEVIESAYFEQKTS